MSFDRVLGSTFPGAVDESAFVSATPTALQPLGFSRENTLACLATCRDEISQSWAISVTEAWGYPFSLTGLGGLILAGRVGFGAEPRRARALPVSGRAPRCHRYGW